MKGVVQEKVIVTFEGRWSQGRVPLSALPMNQPFALSPGDTRLLDKAGEVSEELEQLMANFAR